MNSDDKGAAVKFPPPLIFLILMLAAYGVHTLWPLGLGSWPVIRPVGVGLVIFGFGVIAWSAWAFTRTKTHIEPWKPTHAIISTGVYRYSRNPIYTSFCLIQIGVGLMFNSFWVVASVVVSAMLVYQWVIKKEEAYLSAKFGDAYRRYQERVRRWI